MTISKFKPMFALVSFLALTTFAGADGLSRANESTDSDSTRNSGTGYFGLLAGGNTVPDSEQDATPAFGLTFGYKPHPSFGIGLLGTYHGQENSGSFLGVSTGTSVRTYVLAGQANYFVGGFHMGLEMGSTIHTWSANIGDAAVGDSRSAMIYGPQAGYDFIIGKSVSIGAEAHYLMSDANQEPKNLQAFAALKLWQ